MGVMSAAGFVIEETEAVSRLVLKNSAVGAVLRRFGNGRTCSTSQDGVGYRLHGLTAEDARKRFPALFQIC